MASETDPEGRYPSDGGRLVDKAAERLLSLVPGASVTRTRDAIQIDTLELDGELTLLVTPEALEVRLSTTEWTTGYAGPAPSSTLWKRVTWKALGGDSTRLEALLQEGRLRLAGEFTACRYCGQRVARAHRIGRACHGCASAHEGVVY